MTGLNEKKPMKHVFHIIIFAALISCQSTSVHNGIERQLKEYPESRVLDIYKCFCQDNLGPEHLIPNPETAADYLASELTEYSHDLASRKYSKPTLRYFATGDEGHYVRVDLSVVLDGFMTADEYLDAFVRSANQGTKRTTEQWKAKWADVERCIRKRYMTIPDADKDLQEIKALMDEGHFIIHHSEKFGQVYNPHYRIIAKDIFETEILPLIK